MSIEIHGVCDERFQPLKDAFAANFEDGLEVGASLAVTQHGESIVDLWGGYADGASQRPWEKDTIVQVASTTKIAAILCMLVLLDRGQIDLGERVAHYWPEFAQGGKDAVTIRDAMTHQAGVPGFDPPVTAALACDWEAITTRLAAAPHRFVGKRQVCYHAATYGFLLGEIIRRVDGRHPRQFFYEEIAWKIGADFQLGLSSEAEMARNAVLSIPSGAFAPDGDAGKLLNSIDFTDVFNGVLGWTWFAHEVPGGMGVGNGRSIARLLSILANGGEVDGVPILSPEIIAEAGREQAYGQCPNLGWLRLGLGFGIDSKEFPAPSPTSMHWGGFGGSWALADPRAAVSLGYAPSNWIIPSPDSTQIDLGELDPRLGRFVGVLHALLPQL